MKTKKFMQVVLCALLMGVIFIAPQIGSGQVVAVDVVIYVAPRLNSALGASWASNVIEATLSGDTKSVVRTSPTNICASGGWFTPEDIMAVPTSSTNTFARGAFGPTGVWEGHPGDTLVACIRARAVGGGSSVSLSEIVFGSTSSDPDHILAKTATFTTNSYTTTAIGITDSGSRITNGASSQLVREVILSVALKNFAVSTTNDVAEVTQYLTQYSPFTNSVTVSVMRGGNTVASTSANAVLTTRPGLLATPITTSTDILNLVTTMGSSPWYRLERVDELKGNGPITNWVDTGIIVRPRELVIIPVSSPDWRFFRLVH